MTYELTSSGNLAGANSGSSEYRRTHYRIYDENGFVGGFATTEPDNYTLDRVFTYVSERFDGTGGTGFDSKDLVVLLGSRIVAVVLKGLDGLPRITRFSQGSDVATLHEEKSP
jgi:hypothetical protein